ncbi:MAG: LytTR family DNA-binding domain-containing protein [Pseudomonadota bacterium]
MKVLVVDDEVLARERLLRLLDKLRPDSTQLEAGSGQQALEQVQAHGPELVLLDIRMPAMDGIEVAAALDELPNPPAIIFCTAYDQYALDALQHQAVAYLLKPVREVELQRALDNAGRVNRVQLASLRAETDVTGRGRTQVTSETHRGLESLPVAEVRCFIAGQKYVTAWSPERELLLPDTLKELEREFTGAFVRVHRNALVALQYVTGLEKTDESGWYVALEGVDQRPAVSRRHLREVKERLRQR